MVVIVGLRLGLAIVAQAQRSRKDYSDFRLRLRLPLLLLIVLGFASCDKVAVDGAVDCFKPPLDVHPKDCCYMPSLLEESLLIDCKGIHGGELLMKGPIHERGSCFIECAMNATGTLVNGVLDLSKVLHLITTRMKNNPAVMQIYVASSLQCFQNPAQYITSNFHPKDSKHCNPMAARFISCVNMESFKICLPDFWNNSDSCNILRKHIASCPIPT